MKRKILSTLIVVFALLVSFLSPISSYAEEETPDINIGIRPTSKIFQINSNSTYEDTFEAKNDSDKDVKVEIFAAPYSYVYSDEEEAYKLGFSKENNYTQISRWISIKNDAGEFVEKPVFNIKANDSIKVTYRINTPKNIPAGGQYAVVFVHSLANVSNDQNGIRTEVSPGYIIYGRSNEGDAVTKPGISDLKINRNITENNITRNNFNASAKVKNDGNIDFTAVGKLKVEGIFGGVKYESNDGNGVRLSVIPEVELTIADEWQETPSFGFFKATWTVEAGENKEEISRFIILLPPFVIIIGIILLTILAIWIIITIRRRKERRSRLAV